MGAKTKGGVCIWFLLPLKKNKYQAILQFLIMHLCAIIKAYEKAF